MSFDVILFFVLAVTAVGSALLMVTRANPVNSALYLILNFIAIAGMYLTLHAQFLAVIQVTVYAGAIMVLVLFVIMLLNLGQLARLKEGIRFKQYTAVALGVAFLVLLVPLLAALSNAQYQAQSPAALRIGTIQTVGDLLLSDFLFPFELTSVLLLAAIVGAVALAKKKFPS